jgi:hypothetical protein
MRGVWAHRHRTVEFVQDSGGPELLGHTLLTQLPDDVLDLVFARGA